MQNFGDGLQTFCFVSERVQWEVGSVLFWTGLLFFDTARHEPGGIKKREYKIKTYCLLHGTREFLGPWPPVCFYFIFHSNEVE